MSSLDLAKRVVALTRQRAGYASMLKRGVLTQAEQDALCSAIDKEVAAIRSQSVLDLGESSKSGTATKK